MFDGTLGAWNTTPVDSELKDDANPVCLQPYPVPRAHEAMFRKEVERLVGLGVLEEANDSKWGSPSFAQPKAKTNHVRFLSDFRNLNRQLKHKPYPMPKICEMLLNLEGFQNATSLDLNMGYYHIRLRHQASNLCTITPPRGNYRYKCVPMGVSNSPDFFFWEKMNETFRGFEFIRSMHLRGPVDNHRGRLVRPLRRNRN